MILKESFGGSLAGMGVADYKQDGMRELIAVSTEGEGWAYYFLLSAQAQCLIVRAYLAPRDGGVVKQNDPSQAILHDYELTRQNLLMESRAQG